MVHERSSDEATATFVEAPESVREARHFVREVLAGDDEDVADDAALLASELATNAVIHAQTPFRVTIRRVDGVVRVEVRDGSRATARRYRFSPTSGTGRGLGMVEDLADRWGVEEASDGKVVWFTLTRRRRVAGGDDAEPDPGRAAGPPDLDALLADLGGWDDDEASAALRRAA